MNEKTVFKEAGKKNRLYLVHFSNLRAGYFTSKEKKEDICKDLERQCKGVLAWFGKRAAASDVPYNMIGVFCEKSSYQDKLAMLVDSFDIGGIFVGPQKFAIPTNLPANVFRVNRRMGFLPDKAYLKELLNSEGGSLRPMMSVDEEHPSALKTYEARIETDYVEYRFEQEPYFDQHEKEATVAEIYGETMRAKARTSQIPAIRKDEPQQYPDRLRDSASDRGYAQRDMSMYGRDVGPYGQQRDVSPREQGYQGYPSMSFRGSAGERDSGRMSPRVDQGYQYPAANLRDSSGDRRYVQTTTEVSQIPHSSYSPRDQQYHEAYAHRYGVRDSDKEEGQRDYGQRGDYDRPKEQQSFGDKMSEKFGGMMDRLKGSSGESGQQRDTGYQQQQRGYEGFKGSSGESGQQRDIGYQQQQRGYGSEGREGEHAGI
jgi:hypothetical protein